MDSVDREQFIIFYATEVDISSVESKSHLTGQKVGVPRFSSFSLAGILVLND